MNKKRIVTGIGVVLLTTGVIGGIWSGIGAMPKIISNSQIAQEKLNEEEVLYKGEINLSKLNINLIKSHVAIKKYDGKDVIVKWSGNKNLSTITTKEGNKELTINEEFKNNRLGKSIDDIVRYFVDELYAPQTSEITVYVPDNIDINVNTNSGRLDINDINANSLKFNTLHGSISLNENSNIKNLNIKSNGSISLKTREVYCSDNLSIESSYVEIYEEALLNGESKIPQNVKILINNKYSDSFNDSVDINTNLPIAKNLDITSNEGVDLNLPIADYKFNFDIKTLKNIYFDNESINKYLGTSLEKNLKYRDDEYILNQSSFEGLINEKLINNANEYFVNIRSSNVEFK